jgi:phage tail sheath protein FI
MPFAVSPGVRVSEIDLTTVVPAVSSTEGAIAGVFRWGPVNTRVLISNEDELAARFGKPNGTNDETFFTAASFLSYANKLYVVRAKDAAMRNALANTGSVTNSAVFFVGSQDEYDQKVLNGTFGDDADVKFIAKWPGALGSSLRVSVCDSPNAYTRSVNLVSGFVSSTLISDAGTDLSINVNSSTATVRVTNSVSGTIADAQTVANGARATLAVGDILTIGNSTIGTQEVKIRTLGTVTTNATHAFFTITLTGRSSLKSAFDTNTIRRKWEFANVVGQRANTTPYQRQFGNTSAQDELHIVVSDRLGKITGTPGTVLEVWKSLSRSTDAKSESGASIYYKDVLAQQSQWVWAANDLDGAPSADSDLLVDSTNIIPTAINFIGGVDSADESTISLSSLAEGYDEFASASQVDVSLILSGKARGGEVGEQLANYIVDNICEVRKDCVAFISPPYEDVVNNIGNELDSLVEFRSYLRSTSYAVLDSGYKYAYDKYNDVYRWVPLNGDIAGLCVRTDTLRDSWWSPAGFNRGQVKNIIKLAYNPSLESHRDILYQDGINPVLYGDKTLLDKPSAFDRINVRRLFITLQKAISTAAKFTLFEFNDEFTRAQFRNLVEPFLRDVQGRRGITDFKVVCDETNNTGEVIDRNEFIGDIYIKPVRSINFIQLNFVAVRTGVEFSEIVGQF